MFFFCLSRKPFYGYIALRGLESKENLLQTQMPQEVTTIGLFPFWNKKLHVVHTHARMIFIYSQHF